MQVLIIVREGGEKEQSSEFEDRWVCHAEGYCRIKKTHISPQRPCAFARIIGCSWFDSGKASRAKGVESISASEKYIWDDSENAYLD